MGLKCTGNLLGDKGWEITSGEVGLGDCIYYSPMPLFQVIITTVE